MSFTSRPASRLRNCQDVCTGLVPTLKAHNCFWYCQIIAVITYIHVPHHLRHSYNCLTKSNTCTDLLALLNHGRPGHVLGKSWGTLADPECSNAIKESCVRTWRLQTGHLWDGNKQHIPHRVAWTKGDNELNKSQALLSCTFRTMAVSSLTDLIQANPGML